MQNNIYVCLWFDGKAKEAADFYCSIFPNSKIIFANPSVVNFEIDGKKIMALNGGDQYKPTEAVSLVVTCNNQEEIDAYWSQLTSDGGKESLCGWCKDKYGFSWQIVPSILNTLMTNDEKAQKVMGKLMGMKKIDIETLINA